MTISVKDSEEKIGPSVSRHEVKVSHEFSRERCAANQINEGSVAIRHLNAKCLCFFNCTRKF